MFSFFSRKPVERARKSLDDSLAHNEQQQQLRTPSPSVDSAIGKNIQNLHPAIQDPPITPSPPPAGPSVDIDLGLINDPAAIHSLISSVPPKTLHEYILARLIPPARSSNTHNDNNATVIHPPSSLTLTHLTSFFSTLTPPPQLHCVRCHKSYYEVENVERSCLVPHDDESAEVERVGLGRGADTQYETLYNCCGRTVEGEGDMGPPDGWCYEGKHTTDTKRARFRADSTMHDDKLISCERSKCFEPAASDDNASSESESSSRRSRVRKRKRSTRKREEAEAEIAQPTTEDFIMDGDVISGHMDDTDIENEDDTRSLTSTRSKSRQKKKLKSAPTTPSSARAALVSESASTSKSASKVASTSTSKPRKKRAKTKHDDKPFKPEALHFDEEEDDDDGMDVDDSASVSAGPRKTKRGSKGTRVTMSTTGKEKAKDGNSLSKAIIPPKVEVELPASSRPVPRSSPTRQNQNQPESAASGDEGRRRNDSHRDKDRVSFALDTTASTKTKTTSDSTGTGTGGKTRSTLARPRAKMLAKVVASSIDGEI
ncbi:hypothetical protein DFH05DRAFT_1493129 [Lentinula detonsa]|uniref:Uncharacterized protein n=1 Tax=Lentinula detonsa TaxID=2804962 RepID=A0A9W8NZK6_9AGAR|nr:hypothetical protein DFH05DRAFT_1493129 [Lentinula detonsa]